jgi:hypothetical protein
MKNESEKHPHERGITGKTLRAVRAVRTLKIHHEKVEESKTPRGWLAKLPKIQHGPNDGPRSE